MNSFLESDCKGCCLKFAFPMGHYFSFLEGSLEEGQEDGKGEEQGKSLFFHTSPLPQFYLLISSSYPHHSKEVLIINSWAEVGKKKDTKSTSFLNT